MWRGPCKSVDFALGFTNSILVLLGPSLDIRIGSINTYVKQHGSPWPNVFREEPSAWLVCQLTRDKHLIISVSLWNGEGPGEGTDWHNCFVNKPFIKHFLWLLFSLSAVIIQPLHILLGALATAMRLPPCRCALILGSVPLVICALCSLSPCIHFNVLFTYNPFFNPPFLFWEIIAFCISLLGFGRKKRNPCVKSTILNQKSVFP